MDYTGALLTDIIENMTEIDSVGEDDVEVSITLKFYPVDSEDQTQLTASGSCLVDAIGDLAYLVELDKQGKRLIAPFGIQRVVDK